MNAAATPPPPPAPPSKPPPFYPGPGRLRPESVAIPRNIIMSIALNEAHLQDHLILLLQLLDRENTVLPHGAIEHLESVQRLIDGNRQILLGVIEECVPSYMEPLT